MVEFEMDEGDVEENKKKAQSCENFTRKNHKHASIFRE
jgi:hypothetical protein